MCLYDLISNGKTAAPLFVSKIRVLMVLKKLSVFPAASFNAFTSLFFCGLCVFVPAVTTHHDRRMVL